MRATFISPASRLIMRTYSLSLQLKRARIFSRVWVNMQGRYTRDVDRGVGGREKTERQKAFILRYSMILETLAITETTLVQT